MSYINIDIVANLLGKTIFSPYLCMIVPFAILSQVSSKDHPAYRWSCAWMAIVCGASACRSFNRMYARGESWFSGLPKLEWDKQVVLITGGGSGIGALLAETLAKRNATVAVLTRVPPSTAFGNDNIHVYICDVSDYKAVQDVAERVRLEVGDPTILVNNAGVVKGKLLLDLDEEDIIDTFGANTLAHFWTLKAFLPAMLRAGTGHVVTVASILGILGTAQMSDYCASKAAVLSLHSSLRFELDNRHKNPGIHTTVLVPALIQTTMFDKIGLPANRLWRFLAPPMAPGTVVEQIVQALDAQESRTIRLPFYTQMARFIGPAVGILPKWLDDVLQKIAGADHAMVAYGPHPDAAERLLAEKQELQRSSSAVQPAR